jgi:RecA/RadA recombinase
MAKTEVKEKEKDKGKKVKTKPTAIVLSSKLPTIDEVLAGADKMQAHLKILDVSEEIEFKHSSGLYLLDQAIGGGYPGGRYVEFSGYEGVGKSSMALGAIAEAQSRGGLGIFVDLEAGTNKGMVQMLSAVDTSRKAWRYIRAETAEKALNYVERIIPALGTLKDKPCIIVLDSVPSLIPQAEMEVGYEDEAQMAGVARLVGRFLKRNLLRLAFSPNVLVILINHLTSEFGGGRSKAPPEVKSSGGRAMRYYPSLKLRFERKENNTKGDGEAKYTESKDVDFFVWKNRYGPEQRRAAAPFNLSSDRFSRPMGFDDGMSCLDFLVVTKFLQTDGGGWYYFEGCKDQPKTHLAQLSARYREDDKFRGMVQAMVDQAVGMRWVAPGATGEYLSPADLIDEETLPAVPVR